MAKMTPRTLSGFMELLPQPQQQMERMMQILRETYSLYGFTPLDTPIIEASEVLLAKGGGETEKQIYRFQKGDADLALRFDLTVPLAKYVALHGGELSFPFRRYQIGKVYRGERAQRGRFREFYQADIDVIGDGKLDITNEAEIPSIIYQTFTRLGLKRFQIRVNNRKILNGFYAMLGLTEQSGAIMRTVDKLDKIGPDKVRALLLEDCGLTEDQAAEILKFIAITGSNADAGGEVCTRMMQAFAAAHPDRAGFVQSLGLRRYLSAMEYAALVAGNSSSGVVETPTFRVPTVNIGRRQAGRTVCANVLCCDADRAAIEAALRKALSKEFAPVAASARSPYNGGNTSEKICTVLQNFDFPRPKIFYDGPVPEFDPQRSVLV